MMWHQYKRETDECVSGEYQQINDGDADNDNEEEGEKTLAETLTITANVFIVFCIGLGYPTAVLPIFLAETTSESVVAPAGELM